MVVVYKTGYFYYYSEPNSHGRSSMSVHVVDDKDQPLCNVKRHKDSKFFFCASGIHKPYVNCRRCLKKIKEIEEQEAARQPAKKKLSKIKRLEEENKLMYEALEFMSSPGYNYDTQYRDAASEAIEKVDKLRERESQHA